MDSTMKKFTGAAIFAMALVACLAVFHSHEVEDIKFYGDSLSPDTFTSGDNGETAWDGGLSENEYSPPVPDSLPSGLSMLKEQEGGDDEDEDEDENYSSDSSDSTDSLVSSFSGADNEDEDGAALPSVDLEDSDSDTVEDGDNVKVEYTVRLADSGKEVYRQQGDGDGGSFDFEVGGGHVIPGFDKLINGMKVGDEQNGAVISSEDAYGSKGFSAMGIPPDADLEYDVKVVSKN